MRPQRYYERCARSVSRADRQPGDSDRGIFSVELDELLADFESVQAQRRGARFRRSSLTTPRRAAAATRRSGRRPSDASSGYSSTSSRTPIRSRRRSCSCCERRRRAPDPGMQRRLLPGTPLHGGRPKAGDLPLPRRRYRDLHAAREAVERQFPGNVLRVTSNFRSCEDILAHVNLCFASAARRAGARLCRAGIHTSASPNTGCPASQRSRSIVVPQSRIDCIRDEEASIVAEMCARLIGNLMIRRGEGATETARPRRYRAARADRHRALAL